MQAVSISEVWLFAAHPVYAWYCVSRVNWSVEQRAEFLHTQPLQASSSKFYMLHLFLQMSEKILKTCQSMNLH